MKKIVSFIFLTLFVFACSSGNETVQKKKKSEEEPYIFDAVGTVEPEKPKEVNKITYPDSSQVQEKMKEETKNEAEETVEEPMYFVQIGAFTTQERAEEFVKEAKEILKNQEFTITFSDRVNMFVVQLPPFKDRKEAEKVRNRLWKYDKFKDAFIVTEE